MTLVGEGELRNSIQCRVDRERIPNVHIVGRQTDVVPFYAESDILVLPSKFEGMPMCILEAMASGLAVVASPVGGIRHVIRNGETGLLPDLTLESFVSALETLILDSTLRSRLGDAAREGAVQFSSEVMAERYEAIYF